MSKKRTLESFFDSLPSKKVCDSQPDIDRSATIPNFTDLPEAYISDSASTHPTYPFRIPLLPRSLSEGLILGPTVEGLALNDQPDLDLLYYAPFIPAPLNRQLYEFLRRELFFYRVTYKIKRGLVETTINTPRYTTVFGLDATSTFCLVDPTLACCPTDPTILLDSKTSKPVPKNKYRCRPRPIPECLEVLRRITEAMTGCTFNFCLVNYYASGSDSISYHSDDERFLGDLPAIASFSLGAKRDFLMKHKPVKPGDAEAHQPEAKPMKLQLASGDMVLMRGRTQAHWLHSIPKRKGGESDMGRINITFRKALVKEGTENYYRYNVGDGEKVFRWDEKRREMVLWKGGDSSATGTASGKDGSGG